MSGKRRQGAAQRFGPLPAASIRQWPSSKRPRHRWYVSFQQRQTLETIGTNLARYLDAPLSRTSAAKMVLTIIHAVFPQVLLDDLRADVEALFNLRNDTAHYEAKWEPMTDHSLGMRTTQVAVTYSLENCAWAIDLLLEVLRRVTTAIHSPNTEAELWPIRWQSLPDELAGRRPKRRRNRRAVSTSQAQ